MIYSGPRPKKLAVLTGGRIKRGFFFYKKVYGHFAGQKKFCQQVLKPLASYPVL